MSTYIAIYNGTATNNTIKDSVAYLGCRPDVIMLDLLLDGQCINLANELKKMGYRTKIYEALSQKLEELSFKISSICNEVRIEMLKSKGTDNEQFYFEVGGLDHVLAGAAYSAAFREGATAVYLEEDRTLRKIEFIQAPNVDRIGYLTRAALDILYENGKLDLLTFGRLLYADQIKDKTDEEKSEFFRQNHNTYKVLNSLEEKGWIRSEGKMFSITELGNTARVMSDLKTERDIRYTGKKRGRPKKVI